MVIEVSSNDNGLGSVFGSLSISEVFGSSSSVEPTSPYRQAVSLDLCSDVSSSEGATPPGDGIGSAG